MEVEIGFIRGNEWDGKQFSNDSFVGHRIGESNAESEGGEVGLL